MYTIDYSGVADILAEIFTEHLIAKQAEKPTRALNTKLKTDKYTPALNVRDKVRKSVNYLWLAEGDSALG